MTWVDLSSAFGYGAVLTSAQMQNLRDNITAQANGDTGAPKQQRDGIASGAISSVKMHNPSAGGLAMYTVPNSKTPLNGIAYTKVCEIRVGFNGEIRLRFGLYNAGSGTVYGRTYKNGVAYGSEHSQSGAGISYFEDDVTIALGDLVQIYAWTSGTGSDASVQGITVKTDTIIAGHIAEVRT